MLTWLLTKLGLLDKPSAMFRSCTHCRMYGTHHRKCPLVYSFTEAYRGDLRNLPLDDEAGVSGGQLKDGREGLTAELPRKGDTGGNR